MEFFLLMVIVFVGVFWFIKEDYKSRWPDKRSDEKEEKPKDHGMDSGDGGGS